MSAEPQNPTLPPEAQNQPQPAPGLFTAAQIAAALWPSTKRGILKSLRGVPITGERLVRGQSAGTWSLCALPVALQTRIEGAAQARGYRNAGALLQACGAPARVPPAEVAANPGVASARDLHSDLRASFDDHLTNRSSLSRDDRAWVWREVCRHYEAISSAGAATGAAPKRGELSGSLLEFLAREVPGLAKRGAKNPGRALKRDFQRKLARFRKDGPGALLSDSRENRSGYDREILCSQDWENLVALSVGYGGNMSRAWRELKESGEMCKACAGRHKLDVRKDKSYMPHSLRRALTPQVDAALPWTKSAAAGRMAGPYIPRDWSDTEPGDWFVGDDVTFNHEVYDFDESGKLVFFRPECLYMEDEKTGYPLAWRLIHGSYNGRDVRHESRNGYVDFRDTEDGFKRLGMLFKIRHCKARNPRSKGGIEGGFRVAQEAMQIERGFVGFNEREEKRDSIKEAKRDALAGSSKALAQFHSFNSWAKRLEQIFEKVATEPRRGARINGCSPRESWQASLDRNPLKGMPGDASGFYQRIGM